MKPIIVLVALVAVISVSGCRTQYVEHPSVNLAPEAAPEPAPAPAPIVIPAPTLEPPPIVVPAPTPEPIATPAPQPRVEVAPAPVVTPEATPTPRVDREAYLSKPYPRMQIRIQDETARDPGFKAYRDQLDQALAQRNLEALRKLIDTDAIVTDPGGKPGMTTFLEHWKLTYNVRESEIWTKLADTMRLGAKAVPDKAQFTAPAIGLATEGAEGVLDKNIDPADRGMIVGSDVNARAEPSTGSESLGKLSFEIVRIAAPLDPANVKTIGDETHPWYQIVLPDGKRAWVWGKYMRPWNDYRATFRKTGDQWKMIAFAKTVAEMQ